MKEFNRGIPISPNDPRIKKPKKKKVNGGVPMSSQDPRNAKDHKKILAKRKALHDLRKPEEGVTFTEMDFKADDRPFGLTEIVYQAWLEKKPHIVKNLMVTKNMSRVDKQFLAWLKVYLDHYDELPSPERIRRKPDFVICTPEKWITNGRYSIAPVQEIVDTFLRHARQHLLTWAFDDGISNARVDNEDFDFVRFAGYHEMANTYTLEKRRNSLFDTDIEASYGVLGESRYKFGLNRIDENTGGVLPGELCYIVGRPENGKTMVGLHVAFEWFKEGAKVGIVSGEMTRQQVIQRIHAFAGGFNPLEIRKANDASERQNLYNRATKNINALKKVNGGDMAFCDGTDHDINSIAQFVTQNKVDVLLADSLYMMAGSDWKENKDLSNGIKRLALSANIPVIATLQLKRTGKNDENSIDLQDIAYSDAYGQDADFVFAVEKTERVSSVEFQMSMVKNRQGGSLGLAAFKLEKETFEIREEKVGLGGTAT